MHFSCLIFPLRPSEIHWGHRASSNLDCGDAEADRLLSRLSRQLPQPSGGEAEHDVAHSRPEHRSDAHRTWFARGVDGPRGELLEATLSLEDAHELGLGVGRDVSIAVHAVVGFANNRAIDGQKGAERMIPGSTRLGGEDEGSSQQVVAVHYESGA